MVPMIRIRVYVFLPPGLILNNGTSVYAYHPYRRWGMKRAFPPPSRAEVRATIKVFNPQPMRNPRPASLRPVYDRLSKVHGCRLVFRRSTSSPCKVKIAPNNGNILCWHGNELNECTCHHLLHRDGSLIVVTVDSVSRNSKKVLSKINRVVQISSSAPVHNSRAPLVPLFFSLRAVHISAS